MKRILILSLVLITGLGNATSFKKTTLRLQAAYTPYDRNFRRPAGGRAVVVSVDSSGNIVGQNCKEIFNPEFGPLPPHYINCIKVKLLLRLTNAEMRELETRIKEASTSETIEPRNKRRITMLPDHAEYISADNGNVLLLDGVFSSGPITEREGPAAQSLIFTMRTYLSQYMQETH